MNCMFHINMKLFLLLPHLIVAISTFGQVNHLYVQTDKNNYVAGETIWLKSYFTLSTGIENSNFYAALYNKSGKLIDSILLPVYGETATGSLNISSFLPEGIYFLICYCKGGQTQPYTKIIFISNPIIKDDPVISAKKPDSFEISPKYFVAGIQNTIYFKISTRSETGEISGIVFNSKNEAVTRFKTFYNEYGQFDLYPETGETYIVQLDFKDHQTFITLPKPKVKGVSIQTGNTSKGKVLSILIPEGLRSEQTLTLTDCAVRIASSWCLWKRKGFPCGSSSVLRRKMDLQVW